MTMVDGDDGDDDDDRDKESEYMPNCVFSC